MRQTITFIDWNRMGNTITGIQDNTSGTSRSVQGKDSLDGNVHSWGVESFKHDLTHFFSVSFWVHWSFRQQHRVFFRSNTKLIVESMMPNLFHVIPIGNNSVGNWVFQGKNTTLGLSFITNVVVLLSH